MLTDGGSPDNSGRERDFRLDGLANVIHGLRNVQNGKRRRHLDEHRRFGQMLAWAYSGVKRKKRDMRDMN